VQAFANAMMISPLCSPGGSTTFGGCFPNLAMVKNGAAIWQIRRQLEYNVFLRIRHVAAPFSTRI